MRLPFLKPVHYCTLILVSVLAFSSFKLPIEAEAENLMYDVNFNDEKIGELSVNRKLVDGGAYYSFTSQIDYTFIKRFEISYNMWSYFSDGSLIESSSSNTVNGRIKTSTKVKKEHKGYEVIMDGKEHMLSTDFIPYSLTTLYFEEPVNVRQVFSERYAKFLSVKKSGDRYVVTMPDGKKNYYTFTNGICKEVDTEIIFGKLQFKLQQN